MPKEFDKLKDAIKAQLRKDKPNISEDELESQSFAIATDKWKKMGKKENYKLTEDGKILVGENVKLILEANIAASNILE